MKDKLFLADIKTSYQKAVLACHPDSREVTSFGKQLPAVNDVVDAYKQLASCFSKLAGDRQKMYIHQKSLIEAGRFSGTAGKGMFKGRRFANSGVRNEWSDFLGDDQGESAQRKMHRKPHNYGSRRYDGHFYEVRESNRFARRQKPSSTTFTPVKQANGASQAESTKSGCVSTEDEDGGVWYSKDFFRS